MADMHGRKTTVLYSGLATPLCIILLLNLALNLKIIYMLIFSIGLTYNARSSVAYLYSSEFMETSKRINIGTYIFCFSGFFQAFSAFWFWYMKDQALYFILLTILMFSALACLAIIIPESPLYLLEKERFTELR
jgi:MFS family permease